MIYPTGRASGPWVRGPQRRYPGLLDPMFRADFLANDPFTETVNPPGRAPQLVPRWLQGVLFYDINVSAVDNEPVPARPTVRELGDEATKDPIDSDDTEHFVYPFEIVAATETPIPGFGERDEFNEARNRAIIENWLGWSFGQALIEHPTASVTDDTGEGARTPLSLANVPMTQVSTNIPLVEAFIGVDSALTDLLGDEAGMILMSTTSYAWIQAWGGLTFDEVSGRPLSPGGHFIVVEPGFDGLRGPGGAATAAGKDWIVGTPIIQWFHTDLYSPGDKQPERFEGATGPTVLFNAAKNRVLGIDEMWGILVIRPAAVAALGVYPTGG